MSATVAEPQASHATQLHHNYRLSRGASAWVLWTKPGHRFSACGGLRRTGATFRVPMARSSRVWLHSRMEVVEFGRLTDAQRAELEGDERDPFDAEGATLRYRRKNRHVALRDDGGRLIASAGLVTTEVEVAGERFAAVGLGGVIVNAECRGRGLARRVVQEALDRARA